MCSFYVYVLLFFDFSGFRECCQEFFHGFAQAVAFLAEEGLSNRYVWHGERTEGEGFCRIDIAFVPDDDAECHFAFSGVHGGGACVEGEEDSRDDVVGAEEFLDDFFGASADGERLSGSMSGVMVSFSSRSGLPFGPAIMIWHSSFLRILKKDGSGSGALAMPISETPVRMSSTSVV